MNYPLIGCSPLTFPSWVTFCVAEFPRILQKLLFFLWEIFFGTVWCYCAVVRCVVTLLLIRYHAWQMVEKVTSVSYSQERSRGFWYSSRILNEEPHMFLLILSNITSGRNKNTIKFSMQIICAFISLKPRKYIACMYSKLGIFSIRIFHNQLSLL